jgi:hypothetical protein
MAISRNFNGATLRKPGAYSRSRVNLSGGFPLAPTGVVAIIGEAQGGEPGSSAGVQTYTSEDVAALIDSYKSGPIVDAARILIAPARDNRVANGASQIRVYKTNASTKASRILQNGAAQNLMTLQSSNWGDDENLIQVTVQDGSSANNKLITVKKGAVTENLSENLYAAVLSIQYSGAANECDLEIKTVAGQKRLVATTADANIPADDLSIVLAGKTIRSLVDIINNHASYSCSTSLSNAAGIGADSLDWVITPLDITSAKTLRRAQQELLDIINSESELVQATLAADTEALPANSSGFLAGGSLGASTNSNFQAGMDALLAVRCNILVPLLSRDASALIPLGETDPASTFTVAAVNAQAVQHCIIASNTKNRSERNCYVSIKDSFEASMQAARDMAHERASMLFQDVEVTNSQGDQAFLDPWAASAIVAGIQAGTDVGTPATFKGINASGIRHSSYNPKTQVDLAIDAGLLPLEQRDTGGFRVVVHNTTYGLDANFVFNRVSVLEAADFVAYNLRQQLEAIFVGDKVRTGSAVAIKNSIISIMTSFRDEEIIVGDDTNEGLGWKDLVVNIQGNTALIDITITPVQGIDFILNRITLDDIRQSA